MFLFLTLSFFLRAGVHSDKTFPKQCSPQGIWPWSPHFCAADTAWTHVHPKHWTLDGLSGALWPVGGSRHFCRCRRSDPYGHHVPSPLGLFWVGALLKITARSSALCSLLAALLAPRSWLLAPGSKLLASRRAAPRRAALLVSALCSLLFSLPCFALLCSLFCSLFCSLLCTLLCSALPCCSLIAARCSLCVALLLAHFFLHRGPCMASVPFAGAIQLFAVHELASLRNVIKQKTSSIAQNKSLCSR